MRPLDPADAALTGHGWSTPLGHGVAEVWEALRAGRRGVRLVEEATAPAGTRLAARIERPYLRAAVPEEHESQAKFLNGSGELAATAVAEAVRAAGLAAGGVPPERRALYTTQIDLLRAQYQDFRASVLEATAGGTRALDPQALNAAALHRLNPFILLETLHNNAFSFLSAVHGLRGPNTSLSGWEGTGLLAVALAARTVRAGRAEAAVAVGATVGTTGPGRLELALLGQASPASDPAGAPRPFDRRRDGLVCADGAAAVVLEPLAAARVRGPGPFAVVVGQGGATGNPPPGALSPDAATLAAAARAALREAGLRTGELLAVVAPGSGRPLEDRILLEALRDVLDGAPVPVTATAGALGSAGAAGDVGNLVLAALLLGEGVVPATIGFEEPEPGFEGVAVTRAPATGGGSAVLVLAGGPDGQAQALVLARVR